MQTSAEFSKISRRRIDSSLPLSESSSVNGDASIPTSDNISDNFDDSDYDFEPLLNEALPIDEFDQLSDKLLTGFELRAKIASLSSSSISSCSTPRTESPRSSCKEDISNPELPESNALVVATPSETTKPKKRKRKSYYVKRFPFPRILKRDIRRDYAIMLTNVLNSADESLMLKFFRRFCMSSCQYVDCFPDEYINNKPFIRYAKGVDAIVYRLLQDFSSIPDFVIKLKDANIVQRNNLMGSQIVCQVEFSGTKMFHYMRPDLITSIEEMKIAQGEVEEETKESEGGMSHRERGSSMSTAHFLKTMMMSTNTTSSHTSHTNNKSPSSSSSSLTALAADSHSNNRMGAAAAAEVPDAYFSSPSTLSDTEQNLRTNRMKILSLYSEEYQQLLAKDPTLLNEMKLASEPVDALSSAFLSPPNGPTNNNSSNTMGGGEEKTDFLQMLQQILPHLTGQLPLSSAGGGGGLDWNNIPNLDLLKKNDKPLLSKPMAINFRGEITLSLNEDHCLYQFEVKSSIYDTKVLLGPSPISLTTSSSSAAVSSNVRTK